MNWSLNLKLRTKLVASFCILLGMTSLLGLSATHEMASIRATTVEMTENWLPSVVALEELRYQVSALRRWQMRYALEKDDAGWGKAVESITKLTQTVHDLNGKYRLRVSSPEGRPAARQRLQD